MNKIAIVSLLTLIWLGAIECLAQEKARNESEDQPEIEVVLRFSKGLIDSLTRDKITMDFPIDREIEGVKSTGSVHAEGETRIRFRDRQDRAEFVIEVPGTAWATFDADAGAAVAKTSSTSVFYSQKSFFFDGESFTQQDATTTSTSTTCIHAICPKRRGPVGRIVRRVGWCVARKNICKANNSVNEVAIEYVNETFDENGAKLVDSLNNLAPTELEEMLVKYFPETRDFVLRLATKDDSILLGLGPKNSRFREFGPAKAPIELWLKTTPLEAMFVESLVQWNVMHDALQEVMPADEAKQLAKDLTVKKMEGWTVLLIGVDQDESTQSSSKLDSPIEAESARD